MIYNILFGNTSKVRTGVLLSHLKHAHTTKVENRRSANTRGCYLLLCHLTCSHRAADMMKMETRMVQLCAALQKAKAER